MNEFTIASCVCGKIPHLNKNPNETEHRYILKCCDNEVYAPTETFCMVKWNKLLNEIKTKEEQNNENY